MEVEEERRRRRDRELAAARDTEIKDLIQRTRYLAAEVEEFVEGMGSTVLYGKTREEAQSLYNESSKCVKEVLMLRRVNLQPELVPLSHQQRMEPKSKTAMAVVAAGGPAPLTRTPPSPGLN